MPIYEYQCNTCHHRLEALQKIADALLVDCPQCDQPALKKLVSAASFKLKGSGWYETDFKNNGRAPAATENKPPSDGDNSGAGPDKTAASTKASQADAKAATTSNSAANA